MNRNWKFDEPSFLFESSKNQRIDRNVTFGGGLFDVKKKEEADNVTSVVRTLEYLGLNEAGRLFHINNIDISLEANSQPITDSNNIMDPKLHRSLLGMEADGSTFLNGGEVEKSRSLWIGNIDPSLTESDMFTVFSQFGEIASIRFLPEKECAFVNFVNLENAVEAKNHMQGGRLGNCIIKVGYGKTDSTFATGVEPIAPASSRAIWIGNLSPMIKPERLAEIFGAFGEIESIRVLPHKNCGFINYVRIEDASTAKWEMNGAVYEGLALKIGFAKAPPSGEFISIPGGIPPSIHQYNVPVNNHLNSAVNSQINSINNQMHMNGRHLNGISPSPHLQNNQLHGQLNAYMTGHPQVNNKISALQGNHARLSSPLFESVLAPSRTLFDNSSPNRGAFDPVGTRGSNQFDFSPRKSFDATITRSPFDQSMRSPFDNPLGTRIPFEVQSNRDSSPVSNFSSFESVLSPFESSQFISSGSMKPFGSSFASSTSRFVNLENDIDTPSPFSDSLLMPSSIFTKPEKQVDTNPIPSIVSDSEATLPKPSPDDIKEIEMKRASDLFMTENQNSETQVENNDAISSVVNEIADSPDCKVSPEINDNNPECSKSSDVITPFPDDTDIAELFDFTHDFIESIPILEPTNDLPLAVGKYMDPKNLREIRRKLDHSQLSTKQFDQIFNEAITNVTELAIDGIGNTILQKLLEKGSDQQQVFLMKECAKHLASLSIHKHGTWVVQKMVDFAKTDTQITILLNALNPYTAALLVDPIGNYVIQCCLRLGATNNIQFIYDTMYDQCVDIGTGKFGARAMRVCLESQYTTKQQKKFVAFSLLDNAPDLVLNSNGVLLITWLVDSSSLPGITLSLSERFVSSVAYLSCHKISHDIIIKLLSRDAPKSPLLDAIFQSKDMVLKTMYGVDRPNYSQLPSENGINVLCKGINISNSCGCFAKVTGMIEDAISYIPTKSNCYKSAALGRLIKELEFAKSNI